MLPGTPDALARPTCTGMAHTLAAVPVFARACRLQLTVPQDRPARIRPVLCRNRDDDAGNHGAGRRGL